MARLKVAASRAGILCAIISGLVAPTAAHAADRASELLKQALSLTQAPGSPVRAVPLGSSAEGRPIPLLIYDDRTVPWRDKPRVLVLCGQHGDEPAAPFSVITFLRQAVRNPKDPALLPLRKVVLMVIPLGNPDGAARYTRTNARGADLNRDWAQIEQPETRALWRAILSCDPQVVVDAHEWTARDGPRPHWIETTGDPGPQGIAARQLRDEVIRAGGLVIDPIPVNYKADRSEALAHRFLSRQGYLSYLVETAPDTPKDVTAAFYEDFLLSLCQRVVSSPPVLNKLRAAEVPEGLRQALDPLPPLPAPQSEDAPARQSALLFLGLLGGVTLYFAGYWVGRRPGDDEARLGPGDELWEHVGNGVYRPQAARGKSRRPARRLSRGLLASMLSGRRRGSADVAVVSPPAKAPGTDRAASGGAAPFGAAPRPARVPDASRSLRRSAPPLPDAPAHSAARPPRPL
ncbi:MAG TPA: M14 family zinc carboxypeptidase [Armatimonadota bacterium]